MWKKNEDFIIRTGADVCGYAHSDTRDCMAQLKRFMAADHSDDVCAIFGIKRTGKTALVTSCIAELPEEEREKSAYILCRTDMHIWKLKFEMDDLREAGIYNFFIDEITRVRDFLECAEDLWEEYASSGCKVVITGEYSLAFLRAEAGGLYGRLFLIHTSHVPYAEYSRPEGKRLDEYIEDAEMIGMLHGEPYYLHRKGDFLIRAAAENICETEAMPAGKSSYRRLRYDHSAEEIHDTLYGVISEYAYRLLADAIQEVFADTGFDEYTQEELDWIQPVVNKDRRFSRGEIRQLKGYLRDMDMLLEIPVRLSLKDQSDQPETAPAEVFLQPVIMSDLVRDYTEKLINSKAWNETYSYNFTVKPKKQRPFRVGFTFKRM